MLPRCSPRFKLGVALYYFAFGCDYKTVADVGGIGESTAQAYVHEVSQAIISNLTDLYCAPPTPETVSYWRRLFGLRRGLDCVALAADGTHIPWIPNGVHNPEDYYKGFHSISCLAFVSSDYIFRGFEVGSPGGQGDATIFSMSRVWYRIKNNAIGWLGPGGVVAVDSAWGVHTEFCLTPFKEGHENASQNYFNFCHSSTRFFVEEAFGRLKARWRWLLYASNDSLASTIDLIYTCFLLHNFCEDNREPYTLTTLTKEDVEDLYNLINRCSRQGGTKHLNVCRHCALYHHSFECNCKHKRRVRAPLGLVLWEGERDCEALRDRLMGALLRAREDRQGALGIVDKEYEGSDTRAALGQKKRQR